MDHPLENLGPERFQQLCQALLIKEFPGTTVFPVGQPDGGRDAWRFGRDGAEAGIAFQVKYARSLPGEGTRDWVLAAASGEAEKVERLKSRGASKYFFITNVQGTSHLDVGSIDKLQSELSALLQLDVYCWWRDDLNRRLDGNWDLKLRYPEVLSGQDFLRLLLERPDAQSAQRFNALRAFLAEQFTEDREVKFKQVELQNKLLDLFVDLPFSLRIDPSDKRLAQLDGVGFAMRFYRSGREEGTEIVSMTEEGKEHGTASLLLSPSSIPLLSQVVVEGAPGQGKSTLAQYICQVHRIRLMERQEDLDLLSESHRLSSVCVPFKVDLRDLAEWLQGQDPFATSPEGAESGQERTLETFIARLVRKHSGGIAFSTHDLIEIGKVAPLLVVLDGLDEVADIKRRSEVVAAVTKAIPRIRENVSSLRLVVTSRPAAFANSPGFDRRQFVYVSLGSVTRDQILEYADKWMSARMLGARDRREFEQILVEKMDQPHLRDLCRNPMQLTILLSLILTRGAALPDKRTALYDVYVDLFFSREASKTHLFRVYLDILKDIHRFLAWTLHTASEGGVGAMSTGRIAHQELHDALGRYLTKERQPTDVIDEIFRVMLERVMMIVSRVEGTYEFEVQPLREYFAARYLYDTASYSPAGNERTGTKPDRFDAISRNPYWLNVTRFFCGCFTKGELLDLADRLNQLLRERATRGRHPITLTCMLMADWVFAQSPRAVAEVMTVLGSDEQVLALLAQTARRPESDIPRIPASCGGEQLSRRVFEVLCASGKRVDVAEAASRFLLEHQNSQQLLDSWLGLSTGETDDDLAHWLSIGEHLGTLATAPVPELARRIGGKFLNRKHAATLFSELRIDALMLAANGGELVAEQYEETVLLGVGVSSTAAPFYLVPRILDLTRWPGRGYSFHHALSELVPVCKEFLSANTRPLPFEDDVLERINQGCWTISLNIATRLCEDDAVTTVDSLESLIDFGDAAFRELGLPPFLMLAGASVADMPGKKKGRPAKQDLHNQDASLYSRIRYARSMREDWNWWIGTLVAAKTTQEIVFSMFVFWRFTSTTTLLSRSQELSDLLDKMSESDFGLFLRLIYVQFPLRGRPARASRELSKVVDSRWSDRFSYALARREAEDFGTIVFVERFTSERSPRFVSPAYIQLHALHAANAGRISWEEALKIVRRTYARGAIQSGLLTEPLPSDVATQIDGDLSKYPIRLVERAQLLSSRDALKRVKAVATIAKEERWFDR